VHKVVGRHTEISVCLPSLFFRVFLVAEFYAASSFDDHTARLRRALICTGMDAISLPRRKEMAKEKTPGRSLRGLPGIAALHSTSRKIKYIFSMPCSKSCHHARQIWQS
jgi:hypothetical protein